MSDTCRQVFLQRAIICKSGVERLTTGNEPGQPPRGLTANQNLSQPGAIPGAVLHHLPPVPVSVLRDLTQLPDSVLQNPPPIPAWRSPRRNRINQPSSDCDHSYAPPVTRPKTRQYEFAGILQINHIYIMFSPVKLL